MAEKKRSTEDKEPWELIKEARAFVNVDKVGTGNPIEAALLDLSERFPEYLGLWEKKPSDDSLRAVAADRARRVYQKLKKKPLSLIVSNNTKLLDFIVGYLLVKAAFDLEVPSDLIEYNKVFQAIKNHDDDYLEDLDSEDGFYLWVDAFGEARQQNKAPYEIAKGHLISLIANRLRKRWYTVLLAHYDFTLDPEGNPMESMESLIVDIMGGRWPMFLRDYGSFFLFWEGKDFIKVEASPIEVTAREPKTKGLGQRSKSRFEGN